MCFVGCARQAISKSVYQSTKPPEKLNALSMHEISPDERVLTSLLSDSCKESFHPMFGWQMAGLHPPVEGTEFDMSQEEN